MFPTPEILAKFSPARRRDETDGHEAAVFAADKGWTVSIYLRDVEPSARPSPHCPGRRSSSCTCGFSTSRSQSTKFKCCFGLATAIQQLMQDRLACSACTALATGQGSSAIAAWQSKQAKNQKQDMHLWHRPD